MQAPTSEDQFSTDDPDMRGTRRRTASGRMHQVRSDMLLKNNPTLNARAPELVSALGGSTIGEIRALFGDMSVTQIGQLTKTERQAALFDALIASPDMQGVERTLSVRVTTSAFLARLSMGLNSTIGYDGGKIKPARAKERFSGLLLETWEKLQKGQRKQVTTEDLKAAYKDAVKAAVDQVAGRGRSAKWVSLKEARKLPVDVRKQFASARASIQYSDRYDRSFLTPFPDGVVNEDFAFRNHLQGLGIRAAGAMVKKHDVFNRLDAMFTEADKGPLTLSDGTTVTKMDKPRAQGKDLTVFRADGPFLVCEKGDDVVVVSLDKQFGGRELHTFEFELGGPHASRMCKNESHYAERSMREMMAEMAREAGGTTSRLASLRGGEQSAFERLRDRARGGVSASGMGALSAVLATYAGESAEGVREMGRLVDAKESSVIAEYFVRAEATDVFQEIAQMVERLNASGEDVCLGDADLSIDVSDRFVVTEYDWEDDSERQKTLVEGRGRLLTFDNHAGSVQYAVELDAAKAGELKIHCFYDNAAMGKIEINKKGQPIGRLDETPFSRVAFELDWARGELKEMTAAAAE